MSTQELLYRLMSLNPEKILRRKNWVKSVVVNKLHTMIFEGYPEWIDKIPTHVTYHEKMALYRLVKQLPNYAKIVEIGSYFGASSCVIGSAANKNMSTVYCIDTWCNDAVSDGAEDIYEVFQTNVNSVKERIKTIRGYSTDVVDEIDFKIDLLFVDGDHSYEAVKKDLSLYLPKMETDSILAMHDFSWQSVKRAFDEVGRSYVSKTLVQLPNFYAGKIRKPLVQ